MVKLPWSGGEDEDVSTMWNTNTSSGYSDNQSGNKKQRQKTLEESGYLAIALTFVLSAVMIYLTGLVITPFKVIPYSRYGDIIPVTITYLYEGILGAIGVAITVSLMKLRLKFKWSAEAPYIVGWTAVAVIIVNILLAFSGINPLNLQKLFGGYGLALVQAIVAGFASATLVKKTGKEVHSFDIGMVNAIILIILFVLSHNFIPNSGLGKWIMF